MRRLKLMCLHGHHGSATALDELIAPLRDACGTEVAFDVPDAPQGDEEGNYWWRAIEGADGTVTYRYWPESLAWMEARMRDRGPYDGLLGYSQGSAMIGLLAALRRPGGPIDFGFGLLCSGFVSRDPAHAALAPPPGGHFELPSMHAIATKDAMVAPAASLALAWRFANPVLLRHEEGHTVPKEPANVARMRDFLRERMAGRGPG